MSEDIQTETHWYKYFYNESSKRFFFSIDEVVACYGLIGFFDTNEYVSMLNEKMGLNIDKVENVDNQDQKVDYTEYMITDANHFGKNLINRLFTGDAKKGIAQKISDQLKEYSLNMINVKKTRDLDSELERICSYIYCFSLSSDHTQFLDDARLVPDDSKKINDFTVYKIVKSSILGKGNQGVIYRCIVDNIVGDRSVLTYDCITKKIVYTDEDEYSRNREAHILKYIKEKGNCDDIIKYIDSFCNPGDPTVFYIVSELAKCEELANMIKNNLTFEESLVILEKLVKALKCIHNDNVVHRDIKPNNIIVAYNCEKNIPVHERMNLSLLDKSIKIKILDLGLACLTDKDIHPPYNDFICDVDQVGTMPYFPPPINIDLENSSIKETTDLQRKADVASLGYTMTDIFYVLKDNERDTTYRFVWSYDTYEQQYEFRYPEYDNFKSDLWNLITKMILKASRKEIIDIDSVLYKVSEIRQKLERLKERKRKLKTLYTTNKRKYINLDENSRISTNR